MKDGVPITKKPPRDHPAPELAGDEDEEKGARLVDEGSRRTARVVGWLFLGLGVWRSALVIAMYLKFGGLPEGSEWKLWVALGLVVYGALMVWFHREGREGWSPDDDD